MRQAKLVVMYSLEYYKFKFRKCLLVADKRLRSGLKTHKHIAPSCLLRLLCFLKFSLFLARVPFIVLYILSLPSPFCQFSPPLIFRPFSTLPSLPSPHPPHPFDSRSKEISERIVRKRPSKLSSVLYKLRAKHSAIPLKSRKTQIFSNFLSQSLARFRKSPYFCTR